MISHKFNSRSNRSVTARTLAAAAQTDTAQAQQLAAKHQRLVRRLRTAAISGFLLILMLIFIPGTARAGGLSVLSEILQAAITLTTQAQSLAVSQGSQAAYNQTIVAPPVQLHTTSLALTSLMNTYNTVMSAYNMISTRSATLPQTMALETSMFSTSASSIQPEYVSVYGSVPSSTTVTAARANQIDMADSTANEALALANSSDQAQAALIAASAIALKNAANAAPGTSDMLIAQSAIMQLHSQSIQHHLLAAMLRQRAMQTASKMAQVKQAVTYQVDPSVSVSIP